MPSPLGQAHDIQYDYGFGLDIVQILGQGGGVLQANTLSGLMYGNSISQDTLTAHAGGGQANALPITAMIARITTVASANDSVILPPALRGYQIALLNDAASNACNVYPAVGESINGAGANTPFSLAALNGGGAGPTIFYCFSNGSWRTK